jgi:hypothetical protein
MCFSAGASFAASGVIGVISAACFVKATTPVQRIWACIPLFFSIQQVLEGSLWLSLTHPAYGHFHAVGMYGFLLFAQVIWPVMMPASAYAAEPERRRKMILLVLLGLGVMLAALELYCMINYDVQAFAMVHHIRYDQHYPEILLNISALVYFFPAVLPLFVSSLKPIRWLGLAVAISYIVSRIFYENHIISVWCYFAAVISGIVLLIIVRMNEANKTDQLIVNPARVT